ncbi:di-heme oxidoredictase family protein, partial [Rhizobium ruizarguesonis]
LQDLAVPGLAAEGKMAISYREERVTLGDCEIVSLRRPSYAVVNPAYGPLDPGTTISPLVASAMIGLGLIEAIPEADILAHA